MIQRRNNNIVFCILCARLALTHREKKTTTTIENLRMDAFYVMRDKNQSNITQKQEQ